MTKYLHSTCSFLLTHVPFPFQTIPVFRTSFWFRARSGKGRGGLEKGLTIQLEAAGRIQGSENKPENMGEAIGHEMINHLHQRICVSERTLEALNMRGYLQRDRETGLLALGLRAFLVFSEAEQGTAHYYELGPDCSGPNQVVCRCERCKRLMGHRDPDLGAKIVADVRSKRAA